MLDSILSFIGKGIDSYTSTQNAERNNATQLQIANQNIANQREFAQQGIRWKVADAEAAGLHPLAALGAQVSSYSPVSVGDLAMPRTSFGEMGQDIGRAITAGQTESERSGTMATAISRVAQTFQLEKMNLENEVLKTDIALKRSQLPPPFPGDIPLPRPGPPRTTEGHAVGGKDIEQTAQAHPETASYNLAGMNLKTNPWFSDAETLENRAGEGWGDFFGSLNVPADMVYTLGHSEAWKRWAELISRRYGPNLLEQARGGDRSRYSRAARNMRGR